MQWPVQDLSHFVCVDDGVVFGQVSVQLLDLVFQVLDLRLESLWEEMDRVGASQVEETWSLITAD